MALSSKLRQIVDTRLSFVALEVGKAIGQAQIVNLRQRVAQGLNPTVYCGGYNCRHSLIPVNESIVREQGLTLATASDYSAAATGAASGRR